MDKKSYYDIAMEDYKFLLFYYQHLDEAPNYNAIVVQEQQIVEKLLKYILDTKIDSAETIDLLKSHKLANLLREINQFMDCPLNASDMHFLTDFYFNGNPSRDYITAEKQDAITGFRIVEAAKAWVDAVRKGNR